MPLSILYLTDVRYIQLRYCMERIKPTIFTALCIAKRANTTQMKIGLIRHFKVKHAFPKKRLLSKAEVMQWFEGYDTADVEVKDVDLCNAEWKRCYSSPMSRAMITGRHVFKEEIIAVPELKELSILHTLPDRIKLPFLLWGILVRIRSFSSREELKAFRSDIRDFVDELLAKNEGEVLIVSHWFVMKVLKSELTKRGFSGKDFRSNEHGTIYVYERA
jgi:hypothetical protein